MTTTIAAGVLLACGADYAAGEHAAQQKRAAIYVAGLRRASTNRVGAKLRLFSGKSVCFGFGLLGLLWKVLVLLGKMLVLLLLVDKTDDDDDLLLGTTAHCEGQKLLLDRVTVC